MSGDDFFYILNSSGSLEFILAICYFVYSSNCFGVQFFLRASTFLKFSGSMRESIF